MRCFLVFVLALAAIVASCGGSTQLKTSTPNPSPQRQSSPTSRTPTPATPGSVVASGTDEVTAIVGAVNAGTRSIDINRLAGAPVNRVVVGSSTALRRAGGGALTLAQIRPSDRIIARGHVNDRGSSACVEHHNQ